jgi:hypothetical protein
MQWWLFHQYYDSQSMHWWLFHQYCDSIHALMVISPVLWK